MTKFEDIPYSFLGGICVGVSFVYFVLAGIIVSPCFIYKYARRKLHRMIETIIDDGEIHQ